MSSGAAPEAQVSQLVARPAHVVHRFAVDPRNLPRWAAGLASGVAPDTDGWWSCDSPMGRVRVRFVQPDDLGVLDHAVELPDGTTVLNPLRVLAHRDGCEVVFTLRRPPGQDDEAARADEATVRADLARLAALLEAG